jgi:hypothetical protein
MTEAKVLRLLREYFDGLFPKVCPSCGRRYATLREYIVSTQRLWPSLNYDIELGDYKTPHPIGGLAMANCVCGSTLALSTKTMPVPETHLLLEWIRTETERRGIKTAELLDHLRDEVRRQVLAEAKQGTDSGPRDAAPVEQSDPAPSPDEPAAVSPPGDRPRS